MDLTKEKLSLSQLAKLLESLEKKIPQLSIRECRTILKQPADLIDLATHGQRVMKDAFGFELTLRDSCLVGGGKGVFVSGGEVPNGHIVGLYPGELHTHTHTHWHTLNQINFIDHLNF